jgi:hypothetical protein
MLTYDRTEIITLVCALFFSALAVLIVAAAAP